MKRLATMTALAGALALAGCDEQGKEGLSFTYKLDGVLVSVQLSRAKPETLHSVYLQVYGALQSADSAPLPDNSGLTAEPEPVPESGLELLPGKGDQ